MRKSSNTPPISVVGKEFAYSPEGTETRFMVRGVAVDAVRVSALGYPDVLADAHHAIFKDAIFPKLKELGVNCIRVYQVSSEHVHAKSMALLEDHGIYVMVGLATSTDSINQMTGEYSLGTLCRAVIVVREFMQYDNTFCFSVGNEVEFPGQQAVNLWVAAGKPPGKAEQMTIADNTVALELQVAQAMKSFARDIKAYIKANSSRPIPVGCAMQDGAQVNWGNGVNTPVYQQGILGTDTIAQYYVAGHEAERMDFIGINTYRYQSGATPPNLSAYDPLAAECIGLPVPVFLSESGDTQGPVGPVERDWQIVPQMYNSATLYEQLSGQIAFQLMEEGSGFGLYDVSKSDEKVALSASALGGADALATEFANVAEIDVPSAALSPLPPTSPPTSVGIVKPASNPIAWPTLLPAYPLPNAMITVENYAAHEMQVTQLGAVLAVISAGTETSPTSKAVEVYASSDLSIQGRVNGNWGEVCAVAGKHVKSGITVKNDVAWGGVCNVDPA